MRRWLLGLVLAFGMSVMIGCAKEETPIKPDAEKKAPEKKVEAEKKAPDTEAGAEKKPADVKAEPEKKAGEAKDEEKKAPAAPPAKPDSGAKKP